MKHRFKLNSNRAVVELNRENVFPELGANLNNRFIRSVQFTPKQLEKLERLRGKYKLSKSAIIRILLDALEE